MDRPILKPSALCPPGAHVSDMRPRTSPTGEPASLGPAAPSPSKRRIRAGWKAGIFRIGSFRRLQEIQKSTRDPVIDLSYLLDACLQIALEAGPDTIVRRALQDLVSSRPPQLRLKQPPGEPS